MYLKQCINGLGFAYVLLLLGLLCPGLKRAGTVSSGSYGLLRPQVALTFDDGPSAQTTPRLLDGLKERGVKASFFLIGENVEAEDNRSIVKRMHSEGHLIGNHTYHHVKICGLGKSEILKEIDSTNAVLQEITGEKVQFIRPPYGQWKKELEGELSMIPVLWSVDPMDWREKNADEIVRKVTAKVRENDIILLHDCYRSSVDAALRIIDILRGRGFEFVTVDKLILSG